MTLAELNARSTAAARTEMLKCCASLRWADAMVARRPFGGRDALYAAGADEWTRCVERDWLEAFAGHPRIGDRAAAAGAGVGWASHEQAGMRAASESIAQRMAKLNQEYELKFGHVFLVCATGKKAEEMLEALEKRMSNDAATELRIAADEQAKITRLRLEKLVS